MVHVHDLSVGFSFMSAAIAIVLFSVAVRVYLREHESFYGFLAAAFLLFSAKSIVVGYAVLTNSIEHELLELVDAVGDLGTILLISLPVFLPRKE